MKIFSQQKNFRILLAHAIWCFIFAKRHSLFTNGGCASDVEDGSVILDIIYYEFNVTLYKFYCCKETEYFFIFSFSIQVEYDKGFCSFLYMIQLRDLKVGK